MKCETPARASGSSREPAPIQSPRATERTPGTRSEMTRAPVGNSVSWCFATPADRNHIDRVHPTGARTHNFVLPRDVEDPTASNGIASDPGANRESLNDRP
jgi:hypothetical protein